MNIRDHETFHARAAECRAEAAAATLDNVRDRCLRAEAAWLQMADRAQRTERMRLQSEAEKERRNLAEAEEERLSQPAAIAAE